MVKIIGEKWRPLFFIIICIIILWIVLFYALLNVFNTVTEQNSFGNTSNAISALFSGLAFGAFLYTVYLQRNELALQRQEFDLTRIELKRSADAQEKSEQSLTRQFESMRITAKLNALNSLLDYYSNEENKWKNLDSTKCKKALTERENIVAEIEHLLNYIKEKI